MILLNINVTYYEEKQESKEEIHYHGSFQQALVNGQFLQTVQRQT